MAEHKDTDVNVSLELVVNQALRQVIQDAWDKHHICVRNVQVDWYRSFYMSGPQMIVEALEMDTEVFYGQIKP